MSDYDAHCQLTVSRPMPELFNERPPLVIPQPPQGDPAKPDTWAML
jgi:hypothetical protein